MNVQDIVSGVILATFGLYQAWVGTQLARGTSKFEEHGKRIEKIGLQLEQVRSMVATQGVQLSTLLDGVARRLDESNGRISKHDEALLTMVNRLEQHARVMDGLHRDGEELRQRRISNKG